jgi:tyrosyl-tRNA synthetase
MREGAGAVMDATPEQQLELIRRQTVDLLPEDELLAKLRSGRPLRVKLGVDASGPDIHLGHAVVLRKLRLFQDLGHTAVMIVGDFTGMIGDPSGRTEGRPQLTREQVDKNMATYREQVFKILIPERTEFRYNSEWLSKLTPEQIIRLASTHTVAQLLAREGFAERFKAERPISLDEFLYPIFQGYDSVAVRADVELGGTEQKFNLLVGRELQRADPLRKVAVGPSGFGTVGPATGKGDDYVGVGGFGTARREPQCIITFPILVGTDGVRRMGKSLGNYIGVSEPPDEMFGKIMSIPDEAIEQYFALCTDVPEADVARMLADMRAGALNPRDAKRRLGQEIVTLYHSAAAAQEADQTFMRVFSVSREQTRDDYEAVAEQVLIPASLQGKPVWVSTALAELGLAKSRGEAARLVRGGGVYVDERRITDPQEEITLHPGMLVRVGKRRVARLV